MDQILVQYILHRLKKFGEEKIKDSTSMLLVIDSTFFTLCDTSLNPTHIKHFPHPNAVRLAEIWQKI